MNGHIVRSINKKKKVESMDEFANFLDKFPKKPLTSNKQFLEEEEPKYEK